MSEMVDRLAARLSRGFWDGCESDGEIAACVDPPCQCRKAARELIELARYPTGDMWIAGRKEFVEQADRFAKVDRHEMASAIADHAPEKILAAMIAAALTAKP